MQNKTRHLGQNRSQGLRMLDKAWITDGRDNQEEEQELLELPHAKLVE